MARVKGRKIWWVLSIVVLVLYVIAREALMVSNGEVNRPTKGPLPSAVRPFKSEISLPARDPSTSSEIAVPVRSKPKLASRKWLDHYKEVYESSITGKTRTAKFVVFRGDSTGWGNRIRGMATAFLLALLMDRVFLIDHPDFGKHFLPPQGMEWQFANFKGYGTSARILNPHANAHDRELTQTANLSAVCPQTFLIHKKGNSFHVFLQRNPYYSKKIATLFGTQSAFDRTTAILTYLMQNPTTVYSSAAMEITNNLKFPSYRNHIAVQIRTNFDDNSAKHIRKHLPHTWGCVVDLVRNLSLVPPDTWIFFATDDASLRGTAIKALSPYGQVVYHDAPVVHTSKVKGHGIGAGMVEFFIMSQCQFLVTTGSSFAMAAVREGQTILYAGRAGPRDGCHPMPKKDLPGPLDDRMENRPLENILRLPGVRRYAGPRMQDNATLNRFGENEESGVADEEGKGNGDEDVTENYD